MEIGLYIAFGLLVAVAIGMQVWMLRTTTAAAPVSRRPLMVALRWLNIAALVVVAGLALYVLARG